MHTVAHPATLYAALVAALRHDPTSYAVDLHAANLAATLAHYPLGARLALVPSSTVSSRVAALAHVLDPYGVTLYQRPARGEHVWLSALPLGVAA